MTVPPTDPRRGSTSRSSPDGRPPGWDPRARSGSGDRNLPLPPGGGPGRGESGRLAESLASRDVAGSGVARTRRLGPYRILSLIAQGGMGAVYEALHEGLGRMVALKTMLPSAALSPEDVERFLREAKAASRLAHPNLVPIYDVGEAEGVRYLAMELVRGQTLHDRIRQSGRLEEGQAVAVMIGAAEGLSHAHAAGILHRDLKPANIILQADGTPRLTDFGVAKATGETRLTATGTALGTPNYMSPEQAMGMNQELDARTDVWGLGAILYECLTGQPPFNEGSHVATMQAVVGRPVAPPRALAADLSRDLEAIVLKCLAREREERYPSCGELLRDLRACQAGRTIRARAPGLALRAARRLRRNAVLASLATLAAGSLAALAVVLLSSHPGGERADEAVRRWLDERRAALEAAGTSPGALESLAGELDGTVPGEALTPAARAELRRLRAEVALRRAGETTPQAGALLARAAVEAPLSPAGRSARAALAARLAGASGPLRRELHLAELRALCAGGEDGVAVDARGALLVRLLGQARWEEALPLAPAGDARRALAAALAPAVRLEADRALALAGEGGAGLLLLRRRELLRSALGAGGAMGDPTPLLTCPEPPALLTAVRGQGLLVTPGPERRASLQLIPGLAAPGASGLPPARAGIPFSLEDAPLTWAGGDFDGDGAPDLACVPWERPLYAAAASSAAAVPAWRVFPSGEEPLPWMVGAACAADLDGDGRDELILASSSLQPLGVMARRLDPAGRTFRSVATLGMPAAISLLSPWPLDGRRQGVLAVVDWRAGNDVHLFDRPRRVGAEPWEGRDGLYLLEQSGDRLEIRGHWTYGPDQPPAWGAAALAEGIQAWVMRLGGEAWVARAAELEGGPRLELVRLARLLEGGPTEGGAVEPELSVELAELPAGAPQVLDADGDGEDELVWGGTLLGAGLPRVAPLTAETDEGAARMRLGRLVAAAAPEACGPLIERLEAEHPHLAPAARLAAAEVPLELALEARAAASALLARGLPEPGRRRWAEGEALLLRAGEAAGEQATRAEVPARERTEAALLAEEAWGRLGRREQATTALERCPPAELPPGLRERLTQARSRLRPGELAGAWEPGFGPGPPPLAPLAPLGCRPGGGGSGLELDVSGHRLQAATALLELPAGPVLLEASLRLVGPVWVGRAEVGFFSGDGPLGEARFTGVEVGLWDVYSDRPSAALHVQGSNTGRLGPLPSYRSRLRLRLQLDPLPPGGARVCVTISDPEGALLLAAERVASAPPPGGPVRVGLRCPVYPNRDTAAQESPGFGSLGAVVLEGLRVVSAPAPRALETGALERGHTALCAGDARAAEAAYDQALADPRLASPLLHAARWHRALARGRQGRADAHEDLVQAAREDPLATLLLCEDAADALLFGPADDRRTLAHALEALAKDEDPLLRALAAGLRGQVPSAGDLSQDGSGRQLALAYALMLADPTYRPEKFSLPGHRERELRLPRRPWPPTLDFPLEQPGEAEAERPGQDLRARERALVRLVAREPESSVRWVNLAGLWLAETQAGSPGRAERALRRAVELARSPEQRQEAWFLLVMHDLQRGLIGTALEDLERAGPSRDQLDEVVAAVRDDPRFGAFLRDPALARIRDQAR